MTRILLQSCFLFPKARFRNLAPFSSHNLSRGHGRCAFFSPFFTQGLVGQFLNVASCHWISRIQQRHVPGAPSIRSFCACSTSEDLRMKKCVPCNSKDMRLVSEKTAHELLKQVQDWNLLNEDGNMKLQRTWKVKSFTKGLEFFQLIAHVAEAEGHHPDLHLVGWNNVIIEIWTHAVEGLTENDFILAAKINSLKIEHLLRNKPRTEPGSTVDKMSE